VGAYAQFDFNGPRLSTFVWPSVKTSGQVQRFGDTGYRDALCTLIGRDVTAVVESPAAGLVLHFGDDAIDIHPEPADLQGPEIAMLQMNDVDRAWDIWRPGEGVFRWPRVVKQVGAASHDRLAAGDVPSLMIVLAFPEAQVSSLLAASVAASGAGCMSGPTPENVPSQVLFAGVEGLLGRWEQSASGGAERVHDAADNERIRGLAGVAGGLLPSPHVLRTQVANRLATLPLHRGGAVDCCPRRERSA